METTRKVRTVEINHGTHCTHGTLIANCSICGHSEIVMDVEAQFGRHLFICARCAWSIQRAFREEGEMPA